jgi:mercuric reductase
VTSSGGPWEARWPPRWGSKDGGIAAHNALSGEKQKRVDHRVVPRAIFIDPPVAVVGMTEKEAVAAGHRCWCKPVPLE